MKERREDSLADEQQVYLCWVDQVYVGEGIHALQARVDAAVQLPNTNVPLFILLIYFTQVNPRHINAAFQGVHKGGT